MKGVAIHFFVIFNQRRALWLVTFFHFSISAFSQNVGIGTASPVAKLHIKGTESISQLVIDADTNQNVDVPLIKFRTHTGVELLRFQAIGSSVFIGAETGLVSSSQGNTVLGYRSLKTNASGHDNTAVGSTALTNNVHGDYNVAVGALALFQNNTGIGNTAVGYQTLAGNTGSHNTAVGYKSAAMNIGATNNTSCGSESLLNNTGDNNTAIGRLTLSENTIGNDNTAVGMNALRQNGAGDFNTAIGTSSLQNNTTGNQNTSGGQYSMFGNTIGEGNTAFGFSAMEANTTGDNNTAIGYEALNQNTYGNGNTALGLYSLFSTNGSNGNTGIGNRAGENYSNEHENTFVGYSADANAANFLNSTALGANATITASNQVRIGLGVTSIGGPQNWTNTSDARVKTDVRENVPGLSFIQLLRPVTYQKSLLRENEILGRDDIILPETVGVYERTRYSGFLAQEVEAAARSIGYDFSGIDAPQNDKSLYGLRYAEFVVPLVKAVQELSLQNDLLTKRIEQLEALLTERN